MPTRRFERIALAQILVGGCAVVFASLLLDHVQAQQYVPTPTAPSTAPSLSTPSVVPSDEVTSPANEELPRRTARSHHRRRASVYWAAPAFGPHSYRIPANDVFLCRLPLYYPVRPATVWDVWNQTSALFLVRPGEFGHALLSCRS
jgi:hypothetical protein